MKRIFCVLIILCLAFSIVFAGGRSDRNANRLVLGVTEFEPMNFRDARGNWTGFDTEFALLVGERLGMRVEFQLIEWANKFIELDSRAIDAIWNGFTATANEPDGTPRINLCDMSYSYMLNSQAVVVRAERARDFRTTADLTGRTLAVEAGSAGETKGRGLVGDYNDLVVADIDLGYEVYAIGFRRGDTLRDRVNQAMLELYNEGRLREIARKYGLEDRLVIDTNFGRR